MYKITRVGKLNAYIKCKLYFSLKVKITFFKKAELIEMQTV